MNNIKEVMLKITTYAFCIISLTTNAFSAGKKIRVDQLKIYHDKTTGELIVSAPAADIRTIDGDTFWISVFKVRLRGIDTPETNQTCRLGSIDFPCSEESRKKLLQLLGKDRVNCSIQYGSRGEPAMHHNRYLATCHSDKNVNQEIVRLGWAFADKKQTVPHYVKLEQVARTQKLGLHKFGIDLPWIARRRARRPRTRIGDAVSSFKVSTPTTKQLICTSFCPGSQVK